MVSEGEIGGNYEKATAHSETASTKKACSSAAHNRQSGAKVVCMKEEAVHHIFNPVRQTDKDTKK